MRHILNGIGLSENENNAESCRNKVDICPECRKGIMIPLNSNFPASENHCFVCENCGSKRMIVPSITIE